MTGTAVSGGNTALWYQVFATGHPVLSGKQRRYSVLPGAPRCRLCEAPFGGVGGWVMRLRGLHASERNTHFCNACDGFLQAFPGGAEVPMSMMMADMRGSVELSSRMSPSEFATLVIRMRTELRAILELTDGFILEYQGDSVLAVWPPGFVGESHAARAVEAAEMAVKGSSSVPLFGAAVHTGTVFIGTVPDVGGYMKGISAFGVDLNLLARLAHLARPGQVIVSAEAYEAAGRDRSRASFQSFELKGIDHPVEGVCLDH